MLQFLGQFCDSDGVLPVLVDDLLGLLLQDDERVVPAVVVLHVRPHRGRRLRRRRRPRDLPQGDQRRQQRIRKPQKRRRQVLEKTLKSKYCDSIMTLIIFRANTPHLPSYSSYLDVRYLFQQSMSWLSSTYSSPPAYDDCVSGEDKPPSYQAVISGQV